MIKLSERLMAIAEEINKGETMADIGTDHGYLPLYLFVKGICPRVIMADVSSGSLAKARDNVRALTGGNMDMDLIDFRPGNGLDILKPGETDVVVIAGMGGILISDIIGADPEKSGTIDRFILQPRNSQGKLRHWLKGNGYEILSEHLAREGRFICEILTAKKTGPGSVSGELSPDEAIRYEVPETLLQVSEKDLIIPFLKKKIKTEKDILDKLTSSRDGGLIKSGITENRVIYLEKLLEKAVHAEREKHEHLET